MISAAVSTAPSETASVGDVNMQARIMAAAAVRPSAVFM
jgi:hypothetical protein